MYNEDIVNQPSTPLRQMSLFESFKKAKLPRSSIKLEAKVNLLKTSIDEVIEIEDDSDVDQAPPKLTPLFASEKSAGQTNKPIIQIGINKPVTSTPLNASEGTVATKETPIDNMKYTRRKRKLSDNEDRVSTPNSLTAFDDATMGFSWTDKTRDISSENLDKTVLVEKSSLLGDTQEELILNDPDLYDETTQRVHTSPCSNRKTIESSVSRRLFNSDETHGNVISLSKQDSFNISNFDIQKTADKMIIMQDLPNAPKSKNKKCTKSTKMKTISTDKQEQNIMKAKAYVGISPVISKSKRRNRKKNPPDSEIKLNKKIDFGGLKSRLSTNGVLIEKVVKTPKKPIFSGSSDNIKVQTTGLDAVIQTTSVERHDTSKSFQPTMITSPKATLLGNMVLRNANDNYIHEQQSSTVSLCQEDSSEISDHSSDSNQARDNFECDNQTSLKKSEIEESTSSPPTTKSSGTKNSRNQNSPKNSPNISFLKTSKKRSPAKTPTCSPKKYGEVKSLKAKEGRQLQGAQLKELIKLMDMVKSNFRLSSLLSQEENDFIAQFLDMEDDKKYVIMKLFIYKCCWYNIFSFCRKAHIEEDGQVLGIFEFLKNQNFVDTDYKTSGDLISLLNELDRNQVYEIADELKLNGKTNHILKSSKRDIQKKAGSSSKAELIQRIIKATSTQSTLTGKSLKQIVLDKIERKMGFALKLKDVVRTMFYHIYLLATFANPDLRNIQDYFKMIIYKRVVFPEADMDDWIVFYSRDKFVAYAEASLVRDELEDIMVCNAKENRFAAIHNIGEMVYNRLKNMNLEYDFDHKEVKTPHLIRFTAEHVYSKVLSKCCDQLFTKTNGKPEDVKNWLNILITNFPKSGRIGKWIRKLAWIHIRHLNDINYETAANIIIDGLTTKKHLIGDRDLFDLGVLGQTLKSSKKHKIDQLYHDKIAQLIPSPIDNRIFPTNSFDAQCIRSNKSGKKRKYITKGIDSLTIQTVEQQALDFYKESGFTDGDAGEGRLVKTLLVLYFWDIIYNPEVLIPGVFVSKFQSAPLDMFTPLFYKNREDAIEARLEDIREQWSSERLIEFGTNIWEEHSHEQSVYGEVGMVIENANLIKVLIKLIGRTVLAKIFERIIKNVRDFSCGMPDLLVWNEDSYKFVEVKGEGDTLAIHQKMWLKYLQDIGGSIEVCHVHSMGSKRKIIRAKPTDGEKSHDINVHSKD